MNFKKNFDTFKDKVDDIFQKIKDNKKYLIGLCMSFVAFLMLLVVIFFSSNLNVKKEADILVDSISNRRYTEAYEYYENLQKEFSESKMDKLNKLASKKLTALVVNNGDKYISGEISKEQYIGLININNALDDISIDVNQLLDVVTRVEDMYIDENISYEKAYSYMEITMRLKDVYQSLDEYKNNIKTISESRNVYQEGSKLQQIKKYKEAVEKYDKVVEDDKKYFNLAKNKKEECIELMYDYYLSQAKSSASQGDYEEALIFLNYLKPYYKQDEKIEELENDYRKKVSIYVLSSDDILNLISKRSKIDSDLLSVISYQQTIDKEIYYYAEIVKDNKKINEVLIEAKNKKIYSYKSEKIDYKCDYSDGFYKVDENGKYVFAISSKEAATLVKEKLSNKKEDYNKLEMKSKQEILKYVNKTKLNELIDKNNDIYHYALVKKGWFSLKKEVYLVNIYDKTIYKCVDNKITKI